MKLSDICIRRPVLAIVINLIVVLIGVVAWSRLGINEYPKLERPALAIETDFAGAGPEIIESSVTKVLEEELSRLEGLDFFTSSSLRGKSKVNLHYNSDRTLDLAAMDVLFKLARIKSLLPNDVRDPVLIKSDANARPTLWLALNSDKRSETDLADYAQRYIENPLANIAGVSKVQILGGGHYVMRIWLDPRKLASHNLNALDVYNMIRRQNLDRPGGQVVAGKRAFNVSTTARIQSPDEFNQLIVGSRNGKFIRLEDVGEAKVETSDDKTAFLFNGKKAVALVIYKKSEASPIIVGDAIKKELPKIKGRLPNDMTLDVAYDTTTFIKSAIEEVYETIFIAVVLVLLVVLGFMGSARLAFIPMVTIPVSLIGAMTLLYIWGFSINIITLLAMVLAVGLVVDDAIVVLENIERHVKNGLSPIKASFKGIKEIGFAVVAMTLTLAAVYAPLGMAQGTTGQLFREFALTLVGAVIISGFVALTLSPMMCSRIIQPHSELMAENSKSIFAKVFATIEGWLTRLEKEYESLLRFSLNHRIVVLSVGAAFTVIAWGLTYKFLPSKFSPDEDRGVFHGKSLPEKGATLESMNQSVQKLDSIMANAPEIENRLISVEGNEVNMTATLSDWTKRKSTVQEILKRMNPQFKEVVGLDVHPYPDTSGFGSSGAEGGVSFVIQSMKPMDELMEAAHSLDSALRNKYTDMFVPLWIPVLMQDFNVNINRDAASYVGLTAEDIALTMEIFTKGKKAGNYIPHGDTKEYDIMVGVQEDFRRSPSDLKDVYMKVTKESDRRKELTVPLTQFIEVEEKTAPTQIEHYNRMRRLEFKGKLDKGVSTTKAVQRIQETAKESLSSSFLIDFTGETRKFLQESNNMFFVFGLALLFIFLVLSAQFESFVDPLIIMLSIPLSLAGAALTLLMLKDGSLNLFSNIGMVTLIGLITKHGILIVDFANQQRDEKGISPMEAVLNASLLRLRPILMTTAAMVLGAVPLALADGAGSEIRSNVGWVIVGGMTFGTLFTLFVIPAVYTFLTRSRKVNPELEEAIG